MTENDLQMLTKKLDTIIRLMVIKTIEGKEQTEAIKLLLSAGLQAKEIADILGTTPNTVYARVSDMKKKGTK